MIPRKCSHRANHRPLRAPDRLSGVQAQVVQASRQQVTPKASFGSLQSPRMAVAQKQRMKNFLKVFCFAPQPSLPTHLLMALQKTSLCFCHALCGSDASFVRSVVPPSLTHCTHFTTCASTVYGRPKPLRGESGGGHAPFFVRALFRAGSPRNPRTPARARADARVS
jgi:hypothetical protein